MRIENYLVGEVERQEEIKTLVHSIAVRAKRQNLVIIEAQLETRRV